MPKYYCDYCDTYLTHDSPSVRKTHCSGRKHKENVRVYYQKWLEDQVQKLVDDTTAAFKAGKIQTNPFAQGQNKGAAIPPPASLAAGQKQPAPGAAPAGSGPPGAPPGAPMPGPMPILAPPGGGPMPPMMQGMRPPMGPMGPMGPHVGPMMGHVPMRMMAGPPRPGMQK